VWNNQESPILKWGSIRVVAGRYEDRKYPAKESYIRPSEVLVMQEDEAHHVSLWEELSRPSDHNKILLLIAWKRDSFTQNPNHHR